jgi:hypothetical protein
LCLATGLVHRCAVLTADRTWLGVACGVEVTAIR